MTDNLKKKMDTERKEPLFRDIDGDDGQGITSVESLCMACEKNVSMGHSITGALLQCTCKGILLCSGQFCAKIIA